MQRAKRIPGVVLLLALAACAAERPARHGAALHAPPVTANEPASPNRDAHGPPDVAAYIAALESAARIEDLQVERVLDVLAPARDAAVADIGCGPGVFALAFARRCTEGIVFACDVEPAQLDALRGHLNATGVANVVPVLSSPANPHLPPGRIDLAFVADTYHHIDDRVAYMRRLAACLRPGGRLAILEYKPGELPVGPPADHKLAPGVRERELAEAGYELVETHATHAYHEFEIWRPVPAR
jgi:SAM-dependent methyltransferase